MDTRRDERDDTVSDDTVSDRPDAGRPASDAPVEEAEPSAAPEIDALEIDAPPPRRRDWHARNAAVDPPVERPQLRIGREPEIPADERYDERLAAGRDDTPIDELKRAASSWGRRMVQIGLVLFVLAVGYYMITLWQVYAAGRDDQARPVDAIVVMGAAQYDGRPSPQLAGRLDHVVELWPEAYAPLVVVTGGNQPGDRFTEAEASQAYLVDRGIPADVIVLENQGSTSYDSLERVASMLEERTGTTGHRVLIVTDPYHTLRSRLVADEVGLDAYGSPTGSSVVTGARSLERHLWEAGGVAIGRITGFGWLDDLTG